MSVAGQGVQRAPRGYGASEGAVRQAAREHDIVLLASFEDDDAGGELYWLIRRKDLAAQQFDRAMPLFDC
ncbi:DUF1963 domain-containing protein [Streptomyces microflavus]|uniref:DUF1963 domain-containing protein n=1 Tax=Streptomyces microflavus TaxID=1919 RepID=UPI003666562D